MARRALITGIAGQDGSYLAELLLEKGYEVHGTVRRELHEAPELQPAYLRALAGQVVLHPVVLEVPAGLGRLLAGLKPDECYHLAGPSTVDSNLLGAPAVFTTILESTRALLDAIVAEGGRCRFFFAGSSEMFGSASHAPQSEETSFQPRSIYGLVKLAGFHLLRQYRRRHRLFAATGILYNHESPRRPPIFLPRKVSLAAARIRLGLQDRLALGNLEARRDWGYAPEYVDAMWRMLQLPSPADFVIASGETHPVSELVEAAFRAVGLDWRAHVDVDERYFRPVEAVPLCGDPKRIAAATGWRARKKLGEIVAEMVSHDLAEASERQPSA